MGASLRQGLKAPNPRAELFDTILESCDGTRKFIQDRLERSAAEAKLDQLQLEAVDLTDAIRRLLSKEVRTRFLSEIGASGVVEWTDVPNGIMFSN